MSIGRMCLFPFRPQVNSSFLRTPVNFQSRLVNHFSMQQAAPDIRFRNIWIGASDSLEARYNLKGVAGLTKEELKKAPKKLYRDMMYYAEHGHAAQIIEANQRFKKCIKYTVATRAKKRRSKASVNGPVYDLMRWKFERSEVENIYRSMRYSSLILRGQFRYGESSKFLKFSNELIGRDNAEVDLI
ncbi:MAG: hypothetical protein WD595_00590 [Waddliaceae bacterium]